MKEAAGDIAKHKARELAELGEHRKSAWGQRNLGEVRLGLALEMKLLGTQEPEKIDVRDVTELTDTEAGRRILALFVAGAEAKLASDIASEQPLPEDVPE